MHLQNTLSPYLGWAACSMLFDRLATGGMCHAALLAAHAEGGAGCGARVASCCTLDTVQG
jgi:hypothetical protein